MTWISALMLFGSIGFYFRAIQKMERATKMFNRAEEMYDRVTEMLELAEMARDARAELERL